MLSELSTCPRIFLKYIKQYQCVMKYVRRCRILYPRVSLGFLKPAQMYPSFVIPCKTIISSTCLPSSLEIWVSQGTHCPVGMFTYSLDNGLVYSIFQQFGFPKLRSACVRNTQYAYYAYSRYSLVLISFQLAVDVSITSLFL